MKFYFKIILVVLILVFISCKKTQVFTESDINIIPKPTELKLNEGRFVFNENTQFFVTNDKQLQAAQLLIDKFNKVADWNLKVVKTEPSSNYVAFKNNIDLVQEEYGLNSNSETVTIQANSFSGYLYGIQTLNQLLPEAIDSRAKEDQEWVIPSVAIKDIPRFKWRGLMLDVSRHFFNKDYIKKTIDRLAMLKMNTLHWHLVDDQGWRIEIKKYPKLTEVGAFRVNQEEKPWNSRLTPKLNEKATYGGFYTQEDVKDIVAYAIERGVTIVPEIEMPAHVTCAVASYPELSCLEKPVSVPSGGLWPITDIYCAGKESTFEFLEDVLTEVMELFPSKYIHVGGDEATKTNWGKCRHCKQRMQDENINSVEELQSYFIKRIERFISSKDRVLIGWDEILEGGLAPGATVMSWRGIKGGLEAASEGHDVVMTPGSYCYFDHYQGDMDSEPKAWGGYLPVSKVYQFDPVVKGMTENQIKHILGGQANLWSEYITSESHSEYMIYPRLFALSEALWSTKENKNWDNFSSRMSKMFNRFDYKGINYAKSAFNIVSNVDVNDSTNTITIKLNNEFSISDIRYSLNGALLDKNAIKYTNPINIDSTTTIKASLFKNNKPFGRIFKKRFNYHKAIGKKVSYNIDYHDSYRGKEMTNMVNVVRGSKNFHDGQWQAWLGDDMDLVIDLEYLTSISSVAIGTMENQGSGIYLPTKVEVFLSKNGTRYYSVGEINRRYQNNDSIILKDFKIDFESQTAQFVKVKAKNLKKTEQGNDCWMFVDEIVVQ